MVHIQSKNIMNNTDHQSCVYQARKCTGNKTKTLKRKTNEHAKNEFVIRTTSWPKKAKTVSMLEMLPIQKIIIIITTMIKEKLRVKQA